MILEAYLRERANVKISAAIYGRSSESDFFTSVYNVLRQLDKVRQEIPLEHVLDFSTDLYVSRTSATLHLMLYQVC